MYVNKISLDRSRVCTFMNKLNKKANTVEITPNSIPTVHTARILSFPLSTSLS